jgi:hypothetical protein
VTARPFVGATLCIFAFAFSVKMYVSSSTFSTDDASSGTAR